MTEQQRDTIDYILDNFDFEGVHKAMIALNWKWAGCGGVPETPDLRKMARQLLKDSFEYGETNELGTGGFYTKYNKEQNTMSLSFQIDNIFANINEI